MAVRLNVVMVHPPAGIAAAQQLSEAVVGELIGLSGIDLTLIDVLAQIQPTSTDHLTLSSLSGDVALLAWRPIAESVRSLDELGISGSRAAHAHDLDAPLAAPARNIYGFDLSKFDSAQQVCAALRKLLQSRQVRTYSLDSLISKQPSSPTHPRSEPHLVLPEASESSAPQDVADASDEPASASGKPGKPPLDLDNLVDQLDSLDP